MNKQFSFAAPGWHIRSQLLAFGGLLTTIVCGGISHDHLSASERLQAQLAPFIERHQGEIAVAVKHLGTGEQFLHAADTPFPTASLIKFPLMIAAYRQVHEGELSLDRMIALQDADKVPGSGILSKHFTAGAQFSLHDAVHLMMVYSDNTATNLVIDQVGLPATAESMEKLNCPNTKLHSKVYRRDTSAFPERSKQFGLGSTTAAEMLSLFERLYQRQLVSETACQQMLEHLYACDDRSKLPRHLPAETRIAHKTGSVSDTRCDAGIIESPAGPIAVCVLTTKNQDRRWTDDNAAELTIADIGRTVYDLFNPTSDGASGPTRRPLALGASGDLVAHLQRTLNVRLEPTPDLSVDGDFGPITERAVIRFQKKAGLTASGAVGESTWQALGTLVTESQPVPSPETINQQVLPRQPPESLDGPPLVTCAAWAIADGQSGELLWSHNADAALDFASTTKLMTAYIVAQLAQENPSVLDETVVFSARADATNGSTADIRAGESLTVGQLCYGLLLPSGNDASVALAEHFGDRLSVSADDKASNYERFIAEMNRTAQSTGMKHTTYKNPHGLTEPGHTSTAEDLVRLTHAAMQMPVIRKIVATRQYGCTVTGAEGYRRNLMWKNTNHLLAMEGYDGVKTGTTNAAGACLVSRGTRGDRQLIVVVLGSTSPDGRYVDARNLYRWAWSHVHSQSKNQDAGR